MGITGNYFGVDVGEIMMARIMVYVYRCVNLSCRFIERRNGVKKAQLHCPLCGSVMVYIKTEKMDT